jgi:two-component system, NarL family, nitrate/nitrite response regulator NarL
MNDPLPSTPRPVHDAPTPGGESAYGGVRTVVAASVRLFLDGIALGLHQHGDIRVMERVMEAEGAVNAVLATAPDVLLLDIGIDGALAVIECVAERAPGTRVVVFAIDDGHDDLLLACAEAGAAGWVGRDGSLADLITVIHDAARGELVCTARLAGLMARRLAKLAGTRRAAPSGSILTPREQDVAELLGRGMSNKHIARTLSLQLATVKNHVHSILAKLGAGSRSEAGVLLRTVKLPGEAAGRSGA